MDELVTGKKLYYDDTVTVRSLPNALGITVMPNEKDVGGRWSPVEYARQRDGLKVNKTTVLSAIEDIIQYLKKIKRTINEGELRSIASEF